MYDPVNDEPSECATIRRNIEALSRQKNQLRSHLDRETANVERLRRAAEAARRNLDLAKQRAKAGKNSDRRPGGRPPKWEWVQQAAELAETVAETQRRWEETDRLLLHNERLFEQTRCRGQAINHRAFR
jgi:capsule polysaccharide export protein KpsE/RkpR